MVNDLHPKLSALVNDLKQELIGTCELFGRLLKAQKLRNSQIDFIVGWTSGHGRRILRQAGGNSAPGVDQSALSLPPPALPPLIRSTFRGPIMPASVRIADASPSSP